jgi:hypothetical protein
LSFPPLFARFQLIPDKRIILRAFPPPQSQMQPIEEWLGGKCAAI